ncbi:MAG: tRNA epoxyqueuosine(34) reductase QueG [Paludibacteraceae bacterium]|nr:tRNA epoxyqueuosine(34) reductase QueG [Paludibacteraceae bacterium]
MLLTLDKLKDLALAAGFDDCGAARAVRLDSDALLLEKWLKAQNNGSMQYMQQNFEKRVDPRVLVPGCKTVIVVLKNYFTGSWQETDAPYIAQSGLSKEDYHFVMKTKLYALEEAITSYFGCEVFSSTHQHLFCDSAPVLERRWAQRAGLGQIGKNKQFIHPCLGSFVHIGVLMMNIDMEQYSEPSAEDICVGCDLCVKACPTGALRGEMFDARKCVSYLTIERKEPLEEKFKAVVKGSLYGCDTCARVCPYNKNILPTTDIELTADSRLLQMSKDDWDSTSRRQRIKLLRRLAKE